MILIIMSEREVTIYNADFMLTDYGFQCKAALFKTALLRNRDQKSTTQRLKPALDRQLNHQYARYRLRVAPYRG